MGLKQRTHNAKPRAVTQRRDQRADGGDKIAAMQSACVRVATNQIVFLDGANVEHGDFHVHFDRACNTNSKSIEARK